MVALLVILTFAIMLLVDHLLLREPILIADEAPAGDALRPRRLSPVVAGFNLPDNVRYHPGHTWAASEGGELVRVGIDDFAAKIAGTVDRIDIPTRGQWIRQGQKIIGMHRDGRDIELVSPIEGTVVDVNDAALGNPAVTRTDPYGEGWLLEVHSPDAKTNFRNLLNGTLARRWMDETAAKLRALMPAPAGALAQEGGVAIDDALAAIPDADWQKAAKEFFLTA
ncbi:MAG TPA: glycine cleavage system protein H [Thermoanaerobaculia bacterium]|nr:glycine cleavage system protein H [Thermoanaerobaculia bacterium]